MNKHGGLVMVLLFFALLFLAQSPPTSDPTQCDIAPTSSELIGQLEQATKTLIERKVAVDPAPSPSDKPKVAKREIVIFSADWCEPCQRWKRCEQSKFEQAGYTFAYGNPGDVKALPHFIVVDGDKTVEISGYMTLERLAAELVK
jgi:thioredoxin-related protein